MALTEVNSLGIKDLEVKTGDIAADAITGAKIADDAIDSEHYVDGSIDNAHLADDAVGTAEIADDAITSALIADDAVVTAAIADDAITNALMADDAVGVAQLSATGTASSSTFLRGDNAWATPTSGVVKKIHYLEFGTRTAGSSSIADQFDFGDLTFLDAANNSLFVSAVIPVESNDRSHGGFGLRFAGSSANVDTFGLGVQYVGSTANMGIFSCQFVLPAASLNNNGNWEVYLRTETASSNPEYYNPNSTDSAKLSTQTKSTLTIIEYKNN